MLNGFCLAKWIGALIRMDEGARKVERQNRQFVAFAVTAAIHSTLAGAGTAGLGKVLIRCQNRQFVAFGHRNRCAILSATSASEARAAASANLIIDVTQRLAIHQRWRECA